MTTFDNILVHTKPELDEKTRTVKELVYEYGKVQGIEVHHCPFWVPNDITGKSLLISIGGDGTMLSAMRISINFKNVTVLGLNTGTLGFLTDEVPYNLAAMLDNILFNNNVIIEERMILNGVYARHYGDECFNEIAVNEFVVTGKNINAPLVTEILINGNVVSKQLGSGVLVASLQQVQLPCLYQQAVPS